MRICEVVRLLPHHRKTGGMPHRAWNLSTALARAGHDVNILTTALPDNSCDIDVYKENNNKKIVIHYLKTPPMKYYPEWWQKVNEYYHTLGEFDVIHSESEAGRTIEADIPKLTTVHGSIYETIETNLLIKSFGGEVDLESRVGMFLREREWLKKFDWIFSVGRKELRIMQDRYGFQNTSILPHPINPTFLQNKWLGDGDYYFAYGMYFVEKGIKYLARLSEELPIWFAGERDIGGNTKYLGALLPDQIAEHLVHCKAMLNLTLCVSGFEMTVVEAMAVGTPIFVTAGHIREELTDGYNCIFTYPWDKNLKKQITSIANNRNKCNALSLNEREYIRVHHSDDKIVRIFEETVKGLSGKDKV